MRKGFVLPLVLILLMGGIFLIGTYTYFFLNQHSQTKGTSQLSNKTSGDNQLNSNNNQSLPNDLEGNKVLHDIIRVVKRIDNVTNTTLFYKTDETLISDCGTNGSYISHDRTKILTGNPADEASNDEGMNIFLTDIYCKKSEQLTHEARIATNKYKAVYVKPIAWSPEDNQFLYTVKNYESAFDPKDKSRIADPSVKEGIYLYDFKLQEPTFLTDQILYADNFLYWGPEYKYPLFRGNPAISELDLQDKTFKPFSDIPKRAFSPQIEFEADGYILWMDGRPGLKDNDPSSYSQIILSKLGEGDILKITPKGKWAEYQMAELSPDGKKIKFVHEKSVNSGYHLEIYNFADKSIKDLGIYSLFNSWLDSNTILTGIATDYYRSPLIDLYKINVNTGEKQLFMKNVISGTAL